MPSMTCDTWVRVGLVSLIRVDISDRTIFDVYLRLYSAPAGDSVGGRTHDPAAGMYVP